MLQNPANRHAASQDRFLTIGVLPCMQEWQVQPASLSFLQTTACILKLTGVSMLGVSSPGVVSTG